MRVIVCGGRAYNDESAVYSALDSLKVRYGTFTLIEGGAKGADALARQWAEDASIPHETFKADWSKYGRSAGPRRNREMLRAGADLIVAFQGSRGTADMMRAARETGVEVWQPDMEGKDE